ncbi:hypothetical protein [Neobacillus niacini]|uniref:hypothetical protein n=1 Tax=Neobacillus niacini TaxID=86668 RepID=UPI002FFEEF08
MRVSLECSNFVKSFLTSCEHQGSAAVHTEAVVKEDHNDKVVHVIGVLQDISGVVLTENQLIY